MNKRQPHKRTQRDVAFAYTGYVTSQTSNLENARKRMTPEVLLLKWRKDLLSQHATFGEDVMVYPEPVLPDGWDWMIFDPDQFAEIPGAIRVHYSIDTWVMVA